MATIKNDAAYMALPMNIKRGNPIPLDTTAVWYNKTELETYAASGATAYVGQILTLIADGKCEAYMISNEAGGGICVHCTRHEYFGYIIASGASNDNFLSIRTCTKSS